MDLEGLTYKDHFMVFHQMGGWHSYFAAFGSGRVVQPFKTVTDYKNWLRQAAVFPAWADSAIVYFHKGEAAMPLDVLERKMDAGRQSRNRKTLCAVETTEKLIIVMAVNRQYFFI